MQFSLLASLALVGSAFAGSNDTYVTEVVTEFTTYCPEATTFTTNGKTYTVTEATTLTITDCPCTLIHPSTSSEAPKETASTYTGAANKVGVAGLAAAAGAAVYLL